MNISASPVFKCVLFALRGMRIVTSPLTGRTPMISSATATQRAPEPYRTCGSPLRLIEIMGVKEKAP